MIGGRNAGMQPADPLSATHSPRKSVAGRYRLASRLFARKAVIDSVATRLHFNAGPETVWNHILLYEEVPGRPPFLLRALLPHPVGTEGDKYRAGATVRCIYTAGDLTKRITAVEPPHLLQFDVIEQRLGIEDCIQTFSGSYQIHPCNDATDVVLITNYLAHLRPRRLWRPLESFLISQLHRHILRGVCAAALVGKPATRPAVAESLAQQFLPPGGFSCTVSQLPSRR